MSASFPFCFYLFHSKAVADSRSTQPPQPSNNHSAHPPPGSRLVAVTAATDGDSSTSGGSGGALGTTKREAHWRSAARWVVKPGPAALEQGAQLGDEVKHGDAVVLEQVHLMLESPPPSSY